VCALVITAERRYLAHSRRHPRRRALPERAMSTHNRSTALPALLPILVPGLFVLIWSTGFIVAKFGLPYAPPLTFLVLRFLGVLLILVPCLIVVRAPWPEGKLWHIAVAGLLLQAGYLIGVWCAIKLGMPAGVSALIVGMQPILTAAAAPLIGETVRPRQWLGLLFGLVGVGLVVATKIHLAGLSTQSIMLCVLALVSITIGTLYQRRYCPRFDLRTGTAIQFVASMAVVLPLAIWLEDLRFDLRTVSWTPGFLGALLWSVIALSIGAIFLLFALIRRNNATQVTSLLYLTPPTTALMAWVMFHETLNPLGILGMAVAAVGVSLVVRK
jgi:drug/metabolite transporter (DMT)-like permease